MRCQDCTHWINYRPRHCNCPVPEWVPGSAKLNCFRPPEFNGANCKCFVEKSDPIEMSEQDLAKMFPEKEVKAQVPKPRFADAKVGDEVYSILWGDHVVVDARCPDAAIKCTTRDGVSRWCWPDGKEERNHLIPTWFYRQGDRRDLTERPKKKVKKSASGWMRRGEGGSIIFTEKNWCPTTDTPAVLTWEEEE